MLLGQFLRARESGKDIVARVDLTEPKGVQVALRQQGQIAGIDLCIQIVFDIVNFEEEKSDGERE